MYNLQPWQPSQLSHMHHICMQPSSRGSMCSRGFMGSCIVASQYTEAALTQNQKKTLFFRMYTQIKCNHWSIALSTKLYPHKYVRFGGGRGQFGPWLHGCHLQAYSCRTSMSHPSIKLKVAVQHRSLEIGVESEMEIRGGTGALFVMIGFILVMVIAIRIFLQDMHGTGVNVSSNIETIASG